MEVFEFVMVLVSIIVGLGMATLLTGAANLIRARRSIRPYWVHTLLVPLIFLAHAQVWWESWGLNAASEWSFVGLLMMLGRPICLVLASTKDRRIHGVLVPSIFGVIWLDTILVTTILS